MHSIMTILGGLTALALFLLFGRLWSINLALAAASFIPVWFLISAVNLWIGVSKAGYSIGEELPILVAVFGVPAIIAALAAWRLGY